MRAANADGTNSPATPPPEERVIEAMLFLGGPPLTAARAADAVRGATPERLAQAVENLNRAYRSQGRPYHIQANGDGYRLVLRPRYAAVVDRLYGSPREARLTAQSLDVLALVAYRQPISRAEIDGLRGVDSAGPLRQLVRLGLVSVERGGAAGSREVAYGTTSRFLSLFRLRGLDDLPRTQDLQRL